MWASHLALSEENQRCKYNFCRKRYEVLYSFTCCKIVTALMYCTAEITVTRIFFFHSYADNLACSILSSEVGLVPCQVCFILTPAISFKEREKCVVLDKMSINL